MENNQIHDHEHESVGLSKSERVLIAGILVAIALLLVGDLFTDSREGVSWTHLATEIAVVFVSAFGFFILIRDFFRKAHQISEHHEVIEKLKEESNRWKEESKKHIEGLSQAIDAQMVRWKLSQSEKEVALLILKGLSLKEIASLRGTTEKTVRAQSISVYQKSGLAGRSELAAFFLEDLLLPKEKV